MACIVAPLAPYSGTWAASLPPATERGWCSSAPLTKLIAVRRGSTSSTGRGLLLLQAPPSSGQQPAASSSRCILVLSRAGRQCCMAWPLLLFHDRSCLVGAAAAATTCRRESIHVLKIAHGPTAPLQQPSNALSSSTAVQRALLLHCSQPRRDTTTWPVCCACLLCLFCYAHTPPISSR